MYLLYIEDRQGNRIERIIREQHRRVNLGYITPSLHLSTERWNPVSVTLEKKRRKEKKSPSPTICSPLFYFYLFYSLT